MKKQYRSSLLASVHETVEGLHDAGLMDKRTLRTEVRQFGGQNRLF